MKDVHFRNQHAIGSDGMDFCTPCHKLIIELNGYRELTRLHPAIPDVILFTIKYSGGQYKIYSCRRIYHP